MDKSQLPFISATELASLIKSREISPVEATEAYLERIPHVDGKLNSYITVTSERAMADARQAEQEIVSGKYRGPMHGIPIGIKDQVYTKGILTTGGSTILKDFVPTEDATVVTKLNEAGAVLLGKLNMSEFAMGDAFEHPYGRPHNPWDLSRNAGTSSSGSGAATAAFLCATSLGEDTGGSIRGPASFCGLVGIRPSWGRVSRHGVLGASWSMDQVGPISRTVSDCAITLAAIAGHDPKDGYTWDIPVPDYLADMSGGVQGLKIGVITERVEGDAVDPQVRDLVLKAIAQLGELGAVVSDIEIPLIAQSATISTAVTYGDVSGVHREGIDQRLKEYDYNIQLRLLTGAILPAQAHQKAVRLRHMIRQQILDALDQVDVLVMPTSSIPASTLPEKAGVESKAAFMEMLGGRRSFTAPFNLANVPALSINCGFTCEDLPVGLQIAGKPFDESMVFRVAHAYEQATDWHTRRPPV
ncbi:MAG: Asp-tRNA(Asn)/Glu-tRNA(Gln) amidotransferase GatCAB subunit A [Chloroflexi bacterium]|nr:Asp-tRNA(Asn)/Glu-tRNA(Gln) amidotransferase GatCAB subunit A [Chloroflexota bacterium]